MARQIKRFKVLYYPFFSLTFDSLQAISVSKYKNLINIDFFPILFNFFLLLFKVGSLWFISVENILALKRNPAARAQRTSLKTTFVM
jgi:hypothetical protein